MSRFDPYGRVSRRAVDSVPLDVARALKDQAEAALREVERLRRVAGAKDQAVRERDAELARARDEVDALRQQLATPESAPDRSAELDQARAEIVALRRRLAAAQAERERAPEPSSDGDDRLMRLAADLANVRRRREEEVERARRDGQAEGLVALVDAADDLRRALDVAPELQGPWHDGLRQLLERLRGRIASAGAAEVGEVGEPFDPARHDAIGLAPGEPDTVVQVARTGLVAPDGSLIRPATVLVGQGAGA